MNTQVAAAPATQVLRVGIYAILLAGALVFNSYGAPEYWFSDELQWITAGMLRAGRLDPNTFQYPGGLQIYAPFLIYKLWAFIAGLSEIDKVALIYIARGVSAAFYIAAVYCFERTICVLTGAATSIPTVVLFGTTCSLIHHAHIGTVQSTAVFGLALSYLWFAKTIVDRTSRSYVMAAFASGLAVGAKYSTIYIGVALPFLFGYAFRPSIWRFAVGMGGTAAVAALGVLVTNPFIVLNFRRFWSDVVNVAIVEAPHFQSGEAGPAVVLGFAGYYLRAFFTNDGINVMAAVITTAILLAAVTAVLRRPLPARKAYIMMGLVAVCVLPYGVLQMMININQSRYYIPAGLSAALAFSLSAVILFEAARPLWRPGSFVAQGMVGAAVVVVLALNVINAAVHVAAFPMSGRIQAQNWVLAQMAARPDLRVLRLSIGDRSAVILSASECQQRCSIVHLDRLPREQVLNDWDAFLGAIIGKVKAFDADLIVAEDIIFYWQFFVPTSRSNDYGSRLDFKNPGLEVWSARLAEARYEKIRVFPRLMNINIIEPIIGTGFHSTIEGIGGGVTVFGRKPYQDAAARLLQPPIHR
jgi:hypothetical protein